MDADKVFKALGDPTRRKLLDLLCENNGQTLGQLCEQLDMARQSATQHLGILEAMAAKGHRAMVLFLVQRSDGAAGFRAASEIDPAYARGLARALANGVEARACSTSIGPEGIVLRGGIPILPPSLRV